MEDIRERHRRAVHANTFTILKLNYNFQLQKTQIESDLQHFTCYYFEIQLIIIKQCTENALNLKIIDMIYESLFSLKTSPEEGCVSFKASTCGQSLEKGSIESNRNLL